MRLTTQVLLNACYGSYAIPAVNVFFMEEILALFRAAQRWEAPIIVQTTPFARDYAGPDMLVSMVAAAERMFPEVVFALHLDHGDEEHIQAALKQGAYTSVMIDASHETLAQNIHRTQAVVTEAHARGVSVEAELGVLAGVEDEMVVDAARAWYTRPEEVVEFVGATDCDSLAIAVGTSHGAYKFAGKQGIRFDILEQIQHLLPGYPLVLHGGSNVSSEIVSRINQAGGQLKTEAKGVQDEEIKRAISLGICKINIATDMRLLWTMVNREFFRDHPEEFVPTSPGKKYMEVYEAYIGRKMTLFGAAGKRVNFS
jgi:fructose-bisphosphate aldolase class II